jgi:2-isopropylmalate synthase
VIESEEALNAAFKRFKDLADKKHEIFDEDLHAIISESDADEIAAENYRLVSLLAHSETGESPFARIVMTDKAW